MGEQMVYRDLLAVIGQLRNIFADVVGKRNSTLFDKEQGRISLSNDILLVRAMISFTSTKPLFE